MSGLHITLEAAAVWRVTHLLQVEDGPFAIFEGLRVRLRRASLAGAVDCFYCLSLWVALPFAFMTAQSFEEAVVVALALSAFAILIHHFVALAEGRATYFEQPEEKTSCPAAEMHEVLASQQPTLTGELSL